MQVEVKGRINGLTYNGRALEEHWYSGLRDQMCEHFVRLWKREFYLITWEIVIGLNTDFSSSAVKRRMDSGSLPLLVPGGLAFRSELVWEQVSSGSEMRSG